MHAQLTFLICEQFSGSVKLCFRVFGCTVHDTENLPFSTDKTRRFSEGSCAAIRGRPCGNAWIFNVAMRRRSADLEEVRG